MTQRTTPTLFIDADACPVRKEATDIGTRHQLAMYIVSNRGFRPDANRNIHNILVGLEPDAADNWIADHVKPQDIVITADIPLASRTLEKGGHALSPSGHAFTEHNIGTALAMRSLNQHLRETGDITQRHHSFTDRDRSNFRNALETLIRRAQQH